MHNSKSYKPLSTLKRMDEKEKRIRAITHLYYSNPKIQETLLRFAQNREVVPRYYEAFGKRPDSIQYLSDIRELVKNGATSFHASEELWEDPLKLSSDLSQNEISKLRKGWDLLIDVDSLFLDCSKIATLLILEALEQHGIKNYGVKFSGSKGFHIIVSSCAFPKEYDGKKTSEMFPDWPKAICSYLMNYIKNDYNKKVGEILTDFKLVEKRTKLPKEALQEIKCENCGKAAKKGNIARFFCDICGLEIERKNARITKRKLRCLNSRCSGILKALEGKEYYYCENCKDPKNIKLPLSSDKHPENFKKVEGVSAEKIASLDLILVASRHLLRMPYSLHERTALASVVLNKNEIENFDPRDANHSKIIIRNFMPANKENEAKKLLAAVLDWKKGQESKEKEGNKKYVNNEYKEIEIKGVSEDMFPEPIKKLLNGLEDGRKRGLFILLTFLKSLNFSQDYIKDKIRKWNEKNKPPLKEGYLKSQVEWHLKQKRKILPPNYDNEPFYKDMGLINNKPQAKNPLVEVIKEVKKRSENIFKESKH